MKILFTTCLMLLLGAGISVDASDSELLFYAPFDGSATAKIAKGDSPEPLTAKNLTFVDGVSGKAVFINKTKSKAKRALLKYSAKEYFTAPSGTVSFWVQPNWDGYKTSTTNFSSYFFFSAFTNADNEKKKSINKIRIWMWNWLRCDLLAEEAKKKNFSIYWKSEVGWLRDTWLRGDWWHLAVTWNEQGENKLFVNGKPLIKKVKIDLKNISHFFIGGRYGNADATFDELKIFGNALSDKEIMNEFRKYAPIDFVIERRFLRADSPEKLRIEISPSNEMKTPVVGTLELTITADSDKREIAVKNSEINDKNIKSEDNAQYTQKKLLNKNALVHKKYELSLTKRGSVVVKLPKMQEGDYRLQCSWKNKTYNWQRSFKLTVYKQQEPPTVSSEPVKLGKCLVDIDLTKKENGYAENAPAVIKTIDGVGTYLEVGNKKWNRVAWEVKLPENYSKHNGKNNRNIKSENSAQNAQKDIPNKNVVHTPLMLEVSWPDDKERAMSFYMMVKSKRKQNRDRLSGGIHCGGEYLNSGKMKTTRYLFYPESDQYMFEIRTLHLDAPAAAARLKIYELAERLPKLKIDLPKNLQTRSFGHLDEDQSFEILIAPDRKTNLRYGYPVKVFERLLDYNDYTGQNTISYPVLRYSWNHLDSPPVNLVGGGMRITGWISLLLDMMAYRNQEFIAEINLFTIPGTSAKTAAQKEKFKTEGHFIYDNTGKPKVYSSNKSFGSNPVHPAVRKRFIELVGEVIRRFGKHSAFKGIDLWLHTPCIFRSLKHGYGDYTVKLFESETGISVPTGKVSAKRFSERYKFLTGTKREEWLAWRAKKTTELITKIDDMLRKAGKDKRLYLSMMGWWQTGIIKHKIGLLEDFSLAKFAYETYSIDLPSLKKLQTVTVVPVRDGTRYRHIKHRNKGAENVAFELQSDLTQYRPFRNGRKSAASIYLRYFESFMNSLKPEVYASYFQNSDPKAAGRDFLKDFAIAMAAQDPEQILIGAQPLGTTGRDEISREFARNYRALPVGDFKDIPSLDDPVTGRYLTTDNGTYLYAVNLLPFSVETVIKIPTEVILKAKNLATGKTQRIEKGQLKIKLKPFELKSLFFADKKIIPRSGKTVILPEVLKWYEDQYKPLSVMMDYLRKSKSSIKMQEKRLALIRKNINRLHLAEAFRLIKSKMIRELPQLKKEAANGIPIFTAKFANSEEAEKNWKLPSKKYFEIGEGKVKLNTSGLRLKHNYDGELMVDVDVTPEIIRKHWGGVSFRGIMFLVRKEGFWLIYRVKGDKKSKGNMIKREIKAGETYRFRIINRGNTYVWLVNGKKIAGFTEPGEIVNQNIPLGLVINGLPTTFSNFTLYKIKNEE